MKRTLTAIACFFAALLPGTAEEHGFLFESVKPGERDPAGDVKVVSKAGSVVFDFYAGRGIGGVRIIPKAGVWPTSVTLRLRLGGLESLRISGGDVVVSASVLSHSGHRQLQEIEEAGKKRAGEGSEAFRVAIRLLDGNGREIEALPDPAKGGCFEVALPPALLARAKAGLTLNWVDFFR